MAAKATAAKIASRPTPDVVKALLLMSSNQLTLYSHSHSQMLIHITKIITLLTITKLVSMVRE